MGKEKKEKKQKTKLLDFNFKGMRIEARLKKAFNLIIMIASVGSVVGIIALMVVVGQFEHAMESYALPQGDIALFMNEYAESRSNMRGIIGYEDQAQIDLMMSKHDERKATTLDRYEMLHDTIVTPEGEVAYKKIGVLY